MRLGSSMHKKALFVLVCVAATYPFASDLKRAVSDIAPIWASRHDEELDAACKLASQFELLRYARDKTPEDAVFLDFRMFEFAYYAQRKYINSLDPRMIPVYKTADKEAAYQALVELGVDYVYLPNYMMPTVTKTPLLALFADPEICDLVANQNGYRLLRLAKPKRRIRREPLNVLNADFSEQEQGGRGPAWWSLYLRPKRDPETVWLLERDAEGKNAVVVVNKRRMRARLYSGRGAYNTSPSVALWNGHPFDGRIDPEATYQFRAKVLGRGEFEIGVLEYSDEGELFDICRLWSTVIKRSRAEGHTAIECLFKPCPETAQYRVCFFLRKRAWLSLQDVVVEKISPQEGADGPASPPQRPPQD